MRKIGIVAALALIAAGAVTTASAAATRYEAENATISQGILETTHTGFSGTGYVNGDNVSGSYLEFTINAASAGTASLTLRYSNGTTTNRPASVSVNGGAGTTHNYNSTTNWDTWANDTFTAPVNAGTNTVRVTATTANGNPNIDYLDADVTGSTPSNVYQAESATLSNAVVATNHTGFTGTGFVDYVNATGGYIQWTVTATTPSTVTLRYANGTTTNRPLAISVNGGTATTRNYNGTGNWDTWADDTFTVGAGTTTIRATATTANGGPNVDKITINPAGEPTPPTIPGNVHVTGTTSSSISLAWDPSADDIGVVGYRVYEGSTVVASPTGTSATIGGLAANSSHTYTVTALDASANESGHSAPVTGTTQPSTGGPNVPFGSHLFPYAAGTLKPTGAQATLDQKTIDFYTKWKAAFIKQNCGNGWYEVISPDADHPYVAEGQGYGMVIISLMAGADPNAKTIFDGMVKFMLAHPSVNNANLLAAEQNSSCQSVNGSDSATDGDLDVAYGLLLADKQWGSAGTYNYKDLAIKHINAIKASEVNPTTHLMRLGDWSTSGDSTYYITRSSDWLIDHFRAFKTATGDSSWDTIRSAHQTLITNQQTTYAPNTGLLADFIVNTNTTPKPAPDQVLESPDDGHYSWNACRDPWRIGADAITSGDAASLASSRMLNTWVKAKTGSNPNSIGSGYQLNGTVIDSSSDGAFWAPFAVTAMTDPGSQAWLDALWTKLAGSSPNPSVYFAASIQMQVMIVVSGNYWVP